MRQRALRSNYNEDYARSLYRLRMSGLLIKDITNNENYNPKKLTGQRISNIINDFSKKLEEGVVSE